MLDIHRLSQLAVSKRHLKKGIEVTKKILYAFENSYGHFRNANFVFLRLEIESISNLTFLNVNINSGHHKMVL